MKRTDYRNLLVGVGTGYHTSVRLLHNMVKDKSSSFLLTFEVQEEMESIDPTLVVHYSDNAEQLDKAFNVFRDWIKQCQFELIGISIMSHHWSVFLRMTQVIRETLPECKIIAGNVHAWHVDQMGTLEHCDYICAAEGEDLYSKLIDALSLGPQNEPLRIPGLIEKFNGETIHTQACEESYMHIDETPIPTVGGDEVYYLLSQPNKEPIFRNADPRFEGPYEYVHAGRGCTFKCTFCVNSVIEDPLVRMRSVDRVIEETKLLIANRDHVKAIFFMDEIFPMKTSWVKEFSEKYKKEIGLPFNITLYPTMLNRQKAEWLKDAGLVEITMGLQSGSERIRKDVYLRKDKNINLIRENAILSDLNIMTYYDIIIRNPFEKIEDFHESLKLVSTLKPPFYLKMYTLVYYPHHPLTDRAVSENKITAEEVDPMIGYLSIATPHKVALVDHAGSLQCKELYYWHDKVRARMLSGSIEDANYLLISYYGYWFLPRFLLDFLSSELIQGRKGFLRVMSYSINVLVFLRANFVVRLPIRVFVLWRKFGFKPLVKVIWQRLNDICYLVFKSKLFAIKS
jgi:radical SAM superfamily enzyme YgiQ (UPF0313 family)